jgi:hypothetical protein
MQVVGQDYQRLAHLGLVAGTSQFYPEVELTKQPGLGVLNLACDWQRNYRHKRHSEGWFVLTNRLSLGSTVAA